MFNKNKKIFFIGFFVGVLSFFCVANFVFAETGLHGAEESAGIIGLKTDTDLTSVIANLVGTAFSFISVIFFALIVYAGILWMTARGNDEQANKAKDIIIGSVIGVVLIIGAYAITNFVFENTDFNAGTETQKYSCGSKAGWECVDIANAGEKCKGEESPDLEGTGFANDMSSMSGTSISEKCENSEYCETESSCYSNQVCCELYISGCEEVYGNDYGCVTDESDCTEISTVKHEKGLCSYEGDNSICCLQKQVWCLNIPVSELDSATCEPVLGNCQGENYMLYHNIDLPNNENHVSYFETQSACESVPEFIDNEKIYCFYLDEEADPDEFKCEAMKRSACVNNEDDGGKSGQPFDRIGDCQTALDTYK